MSTAVTPPIHVSWLKKFGQEVGRVLGVAAKDALPIEKQIVPIAEALLPQFTPEIMAADGIFEKAVDEVTTMEAAFAAVGQASNGAAKLQAVLTSMNGVIDQWVANKFPGSAGIVSGEAYVAAKAGLINSIVAFLNGIDGSVVNIIPSSAALAAGSAAKAALAAATGK